MHVYLYIEVTIIRIILNKLTPKEKCELKEVFFLTTVWILKEVLSYPFFGGGILSYLFKDISLPYNILGYFIHFVGSIPPCKK